MERRNFIKTAILGSIAGSLQLKTNILNAKNNNSENSKPDLVAVMGGEPVEMYHKAIEALGGIKQYIKKGYKVVVKPNIGWDKKPEFAANTNPQLVAAIIKEIQSHFE